MLNEFIHYIIIKEENYLQSRLVIYGFEKYHTCRTIDNGEIWLKWIRNIILFSLLHKINFTINFNKKLELLKSSSVFTEI